MACEHCVGLLLRSRSRAREIAHVGAVGGGWDRVDELHEALCVVVRDDGSNVGEGGIDARCRCNGAKGGRETKSTSGGDLLTAEEAARIRIVA